MKLLSKKNKGVTLLEIIISLAILAIVSIPVGQMLLTTVRTSKNAQDKQQAMLIGKNLLEEIKAVDIKDNIELSGAGTINKVEPQIDTEPITFNNYLADGNNYIDNKGFDIEVIFTEDKQIQFSEIEKLEFDYEIEYSNNESKTLKINNMQGSFKVDDILISKHVKNKEGYIAIDLSDNFQGNVKIEVDEEPNVNENLNIYIRKSKKSKGTVEVSLVRDNILINEYWLELNNSEELGQMFTVEVNIKKNGRLLFSGNGYKNIRV